MFLGTPHAGADVASLASILLNFMSVAKEVNKNIANVLQPTSEVLAALQQEFHRLLKRRANEMKQPVKLFCFFEEKPVVGIGMVRKLTVNPTLKSANVHGRDRS